MDALDRVLDHIGFSPRPQQRALFGHLLTLDERGVVAQAGTGTGKSLAILSAAAEWRRRTGKPSLVVTPTNVLMDQYVQVDAPRVAEALGIVIRPLKGRNRYLCSSAPAFSSFDEEPPPWVAAETRVMQEALRGSNVFEPRNTQWFGCPGGDDCDPDGICHYRMAKMLVADADVIVTNAHLLVIDSQLKGMEPREVEDKVTGEKSMVQPGVFPELGTVLADEAHTLEGVLRDFATSSIPANALESMSGGGEALAGLLKDWNRRTGEATALQVTPEVVTALHAAASWKPDVGLKPKKHQREAAEAAWKILKAGRERVYDDRHAVLWFEPAQHPKQPKLVSTQVNMSWAGSQVLTSQPFALVSATVPRTMAGALGVTAARFIDVGHPFSYGEQASISFSGLGGSFQDVRQAPDNQQRRAEQVLRMIEGNQGGGTLLLFSSYRDLELVRALIAERLERAGRKVLVQERDSDKRALGDQFKAIGNAVLFASESFATGFDAPGNALTLVVVWKLPYPGLDPVTKAISEQNRQRYTDMMLVKVVQAIGRLIRTTSDRGHVFVADSRGKRMLLQTSDPMVRHIADFRQLADAL